MRSIHAGTRSFLGQAGPVGAGAKTVAFCRGAGSSLNYYTLARSLEQYSIDHSLVLSTRPVATPVRAPLAKSASP